MNETLCYKTTNAVAQCVTTPNMYNMYAIEYREMCRKAQAKYRQNNKEKIKQYKKEYYLRKKQEKDNNSLIVCASLYDDLFMEQSSKKY